MTEQWKQFASQTLWCNEINSAKAVLLLVLSHLEQAQIIGRTVPDCAPYEPQIIQALSDVRDALTSLRFTDQPAPLEIPKGDSDVSPGLDAPAAYPGSTATNNPNPEGVAER